MPEFRRDLRPDLEGVYRFAAFIASELAPTHLDCPGRSVLARDCVCFAGVLRRAEGGIYHDTGFIASERAPPHWRVISIWDLLPLLFR